MVFIDSDKLSTGNQEVMRKRLQEDDLGLCLSAVAFPAFVAGFFGLRGASPDIGEKQNTH